MWQNIAAVVVNTGTDVERRRVLAAVVALADFTKTPVNILQIVVLIVDAGVLGVAAKKNCHCSSDGTFSVGSFKFHPRPFILHNLTALDWQ